MAGKGGLFLYSRRGNKDGLSDYHQFGFRRTKSAKGALRQIGKRLCNNRFAQGIFLDIAGALSHSNGGAFEQPTLAASKSSNSGGGVFAHSLADFATVFAWLTLQKK